MQWKKLSLTQYLQDEGFYRTKVLTSKDGWASLRCAFCKGQGENLKAFGRCPTCGGRKMVQLAEPIRRCVFCSGSGKMRSDARMVCVVCRGKGAVSVNEPLERCPVCQGTGKTKASFRFPCNRCSGKGVVWVVT